MSSAASGLSVIPVGEVPEVVEGDDVAALLARALTGSDAASDAAAALRDGDVLVVSAKLVYRRWLSRRCRR